MSGTGVIPGTALAATNSDNKIRVYFQAYNGLLRESFTDNGKDWNTNKDALPTGDKPRTFTPLAVTSYDNLGEIRLYYLTGGSIIQELCFSGSAGGWYAGELNASKVGTASYSQLAVVHWGSDFRLYYQRASDNKIIELVRNEENQWTQGATLRAAIPGTRLSAIHDDTNNTIRVYYQGTDYKTHQVSSKNSWADDIVIGSATSPPHGSYASVRFGDQIRVYFTTSADNKLSEASGTTKNNDWYGPKGLSIANPLSYTAAVTWGNVSAIRVYSQDAGDRVVEMMWGEGADWREGTQVPTK